MKTLIAILVVVIFSCKAQKQTVNSYLYGLPSDLTLLTTTGATFNLDSSFKYLATGSIGWNPVLYDTLTKKECRHYRTYSTALWCPESKCNTTTCMDCGKNWASW